jgi:hypothetical protein
MKPANRRPEIRSKNYDKYTIRQKDFQFYLIHAQKVILCKSNTFQFIADPYPASQNLTINRLFPTPF